MSCNHGEPKSTESYQLIQLNQQIVIHYRVLELRALGLPYSQIRAKMACECGVRIPKSTISYWTRRIHGPLGRAYDLRSFPSKELAYLIGVQKGDGSLNVNRETHSYRIRLQSIDKEFVEEFDRCLSQILGSPRHALWSGAGRREIHAVGSSFLLHQFLNQPFVKHKSYIEHCGECVAAFLRGFFDSEDCISKLGSISASNCDKAMLEYVQLLLLNQFGIGSTGPFLQTRKGTLMTIRNRTYVRNSDCYLIRIEGKFKRDFLGKIGITISRKRARLVASLT